MNQKLRPLLVPDEVQWMAMDNSGLWFFYTEDPRTGRHFDMWFGANTSLIKDFTRFFKSPPPLPGPWYEQIYYVGDNPDQRDDLL